MTPSECYALYVALKLHFSTDSYDAVKYNFKTKQRNNLEKRNDKHFFIRLSKHNDPKGLLLSNLSVEPNIWIGNLFQKKAIDRYNRWRRYQESMTYEYSNELSFLKPVDFKPIGNYHPVVLKKYLNSEVSLDTLVIVDSLFPYLNIWDKALEYDPVWSEYSLSIKKYKSFLNFDQEKFREITKAWVSQA